jgi:hypothetical protein
MELRLTLLHVERCFTGVNCLRLNEFTQTAFGCPTQRRLRGGRFRLGERLVARKKRPKEIWREDELIAYASFKVPLSKENRERIKSEFLSLLQEESIGSEAQRIAFCNGVPDAIAAAIGLSASNLSLSKRANTRRQELANAFGRIQDQADELHRTIAGLSVEEGELLHHFATLCVNSVKISPAIESGRREKLEADREYIEFVVLEDLDSDRFALLIGLIRNGASQILLRLNGTTSDDGRPRAFLAQRIFRQWTVVGLPKLNRKRNADDVERAFRAVLRLAFSKIRQRKDQRGIKISYAGAERPDPLEASVDYALRTILEEFSDQIPATPVNTRR